MITLDFDRMNDEQAELASQAMDQGYSQEEIADLLEALDKGDEDAETTVDRIWAVSEERDTERRGHIYMNAMDINKPFILMVNTSILDTNKGGK